ncbi:MAG: BREX-1 system phosphatase PglZ type B [Castellaniella sp.]
MTAPASLLQALAQALSAAASGNTYTSVPVAAVLWPDKESAWQAALPAICEQIPNLLTLGDYDSATRTGPAIWLKAALAGALDDVPLTANSPVILYLPGVGRTDLRAIESCPRALQPLAELQYRGAFWSQTNGKDWTISAWLGSKNGGLGLNVTQSRETQEALRQALEAGVLLAQDIHSLQDRTIDAPWLLSLMAPNPSRDLLAWMNDPTAFQTQYAGVRWDIFLQRCQTDFGFDPIADGVLTAAECFTQGQGPWAAVAELYADSWPSFPGLLELLRRVQAPDLGLFPDPDTQAAYPQINEHSEAALRYQLAACKAMDVEQARQTILAQEQEHGIRRNWLWSRMGHAPLAQALGHLAALAEQSRQLPTGTTPDELASAYTQHGWHVDDAALQSLASIHTREDTEAVSAALRALYLPWLQESARRLQHAAQAQAGLPRPAAVASTAGTCTVFIDGLRYDVAQHLAQRLQALGEVHLSHQWTCLPSVTASGKPWCSPIASAITGQPEDTEFNPRVAADGKPLSSYHFERVLAEHDIQKLKAAETGDPQGLSWAEAGDLDHYGHEHGVRLAKDMAQQLDHILERLNELWDAGWTCLRIVTDHGWLLLPGGLPKSELPKHQTETRWGRCAVLKDSAMGTPLTFGWSWCDTVQIAFAPGVCSFVAGAEYAHGGLSLQESLVPVIELRRGQNAPASIQATITDITWKGLRCIVQVDSSAPDLLVDIRTKAASADTSIVANPKRLESGKANLAVADDGDEGCAAVVVVLSANGQVIQKRPTTVGEP